MPSEAPLSLASASTKPALIVSDVHIGALYGPPEAAFLDFVRFAARAAATLVLNGDFFDVGPLDAKWRAPEHQPVMRGLAEAIASGLAVTFVGGNRDPVEWCGETLFGLGVEVQDDPTRLVIAGREALIAHGDGARHGAGRPYRKPYPVLRSRALVALARRLGLAPALHRFLSERSPTRPRVAAASRGESTGPKRRAPAIEAWARSELARDPGLELVIAGHSHVPALVEVSPGRYYVNAGDWISHHTYAVVPSNAGPPEVRFWPSHTSVDWDSLHDAEVPASESRLKGGARR